MEHLNIDSNEIVSLNNPSIRGRSQDKASLGVVGCWLCVPCKSLRNHIPIRMRTDRPPRRRRGGRFRDCRTQRNHKLEQISREGVSKVKRLETRERERETKKKRKKEKEEKQRKWWSDRDANLTAYLGRMSEPCRIKDPMVNHMQLSSLKRFSRWSGFLLHGWGLYHSYGVNLNWSTLDNSLNPFQIGRASIFHGIRSPFTYED